MKKKKSSPSSSRYIDYEGLKAVNIFGIIRKVIKIHSYSTGYSTALIQMTPTLYGVLVFEHNGNILFSCCNDIGSTRKVKQLAMKNLNNIYSEYREKLALKLPI